MYVCMYVCVYVCREKRKSGERILRAGREIESGEREQRAEEEQSDKGKMTGRRERAKK